MIFKSFNSPINSISKKIKNKKTLDIPFYETNTFDII